MGIFTLLFVIPLSLIAAWCVIRASWRMKKRKAYGEKLLVVKDVTSNVDLFFGVIFLLPILRLIIIFLQNGFDPFLWVTTFWTMYFPMISVIRFVKAFSKVEIYARGILTKDRVWEWHLAKTCSIKESKKAVAFEFELEGKFFKTGKITVDCKDKEKVEKIIDDIVLGIHGDGSVHSSEILTNK